MQSVRRVVGSQPAALVCEGTGDIDGVRLLLDPGADELLMRESVGRRMLDAGTVYHEARVDWRRRHEDRDDAAIARAIISIAGSLGLDLVAEGVELEEHREFLLRNGCIWAQGYLFSRPLPPAEFEARLRAQQAEDLKGAR